jgi:hypothetical protein
MVPVIRITDATWDRLKRWAEPLEDSPEDAVRKVLEAAEEHLKCGQTSFSKRENKIENKVNNKGNRIHQGLKTPNQTYRLPILEALFKLGGKDSADDVLKAVEEKVKPLLNEFDLQKLSSGMDIRWRNAAQWVRWSLMKEGFLKSDSPRGVWELSEKGINEINMGEKV